MEEKFMSVTSKIGEYFDEVKKLWWKIKEIQEKQF